MYTHNRLAFVLANIFWIGLMVSIVKPPIFGALALLVTACGFGLFKIEQKPQAGLFEALRHYFFSSSSSDYTPRQPQDLKVLMA